jgi:hypothetical protein
MPDVQRGSDKAGNPVTQAYSVIRYEEDGDKLVAVCEDRDGNRWYETIKIGEKVLF